MMSANSSGSTWTRHLGGVLAIVVLVLAIVPTACARNDTKRELAALLDRLSDDWFYTQEQQEIFWKQKYYQSVLSLTGELIKLDRKSADLAIYGVAAEESGRSYCVTVHATFRIELSDEDLMAHRLKDQSRVRGKLSKLEMPGSIKRMPPAKREIPIKPAPANGPSRTAIDPPPWTLVAPGCGNSEYVDLYLEGAKVTKP